MIDNSIKFFKEICTLSHPSGHTEKIEEYLIDFAKKHNLKYTHDNAHNVIIYKDGAKKTLPIILQAHMDMVGVSTDNRDMTKCPIEPIVTNDYMSAKNTSLGADDGIGMSYMLSILRDDTLKTPPLECVFTKDEETGMSGVISFDISHLKGERLINLDSEDEGRILSSSAGGAHFTIEQSLKKEKINATSKVCLSVDGLLGGHSGEEIHKRGANAIVLLLNVLQQINNDCNINVVSLDAGEAYNVIPKSAKCTFLCDSSDSDKIKNIVDKKESELKKTYAKTDSSLKISVSFESGKYNTSAICKNTLSDFLSLVSMYRNGVLEVDKDDPNFVITSMNIAKLRYKEGDSVILLGSSIRSADDKKRDALLNVLENTTKKGKEVSYKIESVYPSWKYKKSPLRDTMRKVFKDMYNKEMKEEKIHAGLECGYFALKRPSLDITSIGPNLKNVHTTDETLDLSSSKRVYEYLVRVLEVL